MRIGPPTVNLRRNGAGQWCYALKAGGAVAIDDPSVSDYTEWLQRRDVDRLRRQRRDEWEIIESIQDLGNDGPFPIWFRQQSLEAVAWCIGENPGYSPTMFELRVLLPGYVDRMRRIKEASLRSMTAVDAVPTAATGDLVSDAECERIVLALKEKPILVLRKMYDSDPLKCGPLRREDLAVKFGWTVDQLKGQLKNLKAHKLYDSTPGVGIQLTPKGLRVEAFRRAVKVSPQGRPNFAFWFAASPQRLMASPTF